MKSRVELCVLLSLISAVSTYSLKISSESIEYMAESAVNGDFERNRFIAPRHQSAVQNFRELENKYASDGDLNVKNLVNKKQINYNAEDRILQRGHKIPLPRPFPLKASNPDAENDMRISMGQYNKVDTISEHERIFKSISYTRGADSESETLKIKKIFESNTGAEQGQTDNFQKPDSLSPNQKLYFGFLLSVRHKQSLTELSLVTNCFVC